MTDQKERGEANSPQNHSGWYVTAMERLVDVVQELSRARDLNAIMSVVRLAARNLTGADGATFVLRDGDKCYYAEEDAIGPLWKGQRFPMKICISGWVMLNARPAIIEDVFKDARIPADAYRPTFVKSLTMVPIRAEEPIGAIGTYWATTRLPSDEEVAILQALANFTSVAMENVELYGTLQRKLAALEQSNCELSSFAWAASHDLKSPLRGIYNLASWIEEDFADGKSEKVKEHVAAMHRRIDRMEKLLDSVLEYARLERKLAPDKEEVAEGSVLADDIRELIDLPEGFSLRFASDFDDVKLPRVAGQRVFSNLINNAIKHHDRDHGVIEVAVGDQGSSYVFNVTDDGPGIPPEYRETVFELFQTLKPRDAQEGSGMGLALVRKILAAYGGDIAVEPRPSRGAAFRITWPKALSFGRMEAV